MIKLASKENPTLGIPVILRSRI